MNVYVVIQEAVYRHSICGVWTKALDALCGAQACAMDPRDDGHHTYVVYEMPANFPLIPANLDFDLGVTNERSFDVVEIGRYQKVTEHKYEFWHVIAGDPMKRFFADSNYYERFGGQ